jgi:hypothetical protein
MTSQKIRNLTDDELNAALLDAQSALRMAFARRRGVIAAGDHLDAICAELDRREAGR